MSNRFRGQVAVVTGGGAGIGRATCLLLAEQGARVVVAERNPDTGRATAAAIVAAGGQAWELAVDVADESSVMALAQQVEQVHGQLDVLVNNAAVFVLAGVEATVAQWREVLDVNIMGPALVTKHLVPLLFRGKGKAIVNLGSISSFIAQPGFVTYNATKAAVATMTRCMALDLAPHGIRVNAVCPGTVWTAIVEQRASELGLDRAAADVHPDFGGAQILHRIADPREIAQAIAFLASDEASFITGAQLMVDGGYTAK